MPNILKGTVTKVGAMRKTITVTIARRFDHPVLLKQMVRHKKMLVHDAEETAKQGDFVTIIHGKPISTRKHFRLQSIDRRAPSSEAITTPTSSSTSTSSQMNGETIGEILERSAGMDEGVADDVVGISR